MDNGFDMERVKCPYGEKGDRLWVRESFYVAEREGQGIGNMFVIFEDVS